MKSKKDLSWALAVIAILIFSCKKDPGSVFTIEESQQWILDSMKVYYYFADELSAGRGPGSSATAFFKSLLHPSDRFSYMEDPDEVKTEYSSFAWYGFEYVLVRAGVSERLFGVITLVVPGGPADRQGLKRGDVFTSVNGIQIAASSENLIRIALKQGDGVQLQTSTPEDLPVLSEDRIVNIVYSRFSEHPVYQTRVFSQGSKKTGYIFYNRFSGQYDQAMLDSLNKLKNAGISELILDLRYNPGGDVSSAAKIAVLLTGVSVEQAFVVYQANANGGRSVRSFGNVIAENTYPPQAFEEISARRLKLRRVIVLTTAATASASELLINCLKPYMEVIQVGQNTIGKDMASFAITDQRSPRRINYVLHPLIFKLYNAKAQGDYSGGIVPDHMVDEFTELPLKSLGDEKDPLIRTALAVTESSAATVKEIQSAMNVETRFNSAGQRGRNAPEVKLGKINTSFRLRY